MKWAECPDPAGFLIQLSAFFPPNAAFSNESRPAFIDGHIK
ncbi:hypothetical protein [Rhizobium sp. P32RR-XVIII]|nr:hypothetical protein [Rhizobium sp. P32RR-XVIII]